MDDPIFINFCEYSLKTFTIKPSTLIFNLNILWYALYLKKLIFPKIHLFYFSPTHFLIFALSYNYPNPFLFFHKHLYSCPSYLFKKQGNLELNSF